MENIVGKKKMLVTSIFFLAQNVFYFVEEKSLRLSNTEFVLCKYYEYVNVTLYQSFENMVEKGENAGN